MIPVTVTNEQLLAAWIACVGAKATHALASVKLAKLRTVLGAESTILRQEIDTCARAHATLSGSGAPIPLQNAAGQALLLSATRTPAYELTPDAVKAFAAELEPVLKATVTVSIAPLTAADLAAIQLADDDGLALLPFVAID